MPVSAMQLHTLRWAALDIAQIAMNENLATLRLLRTACCKPP